jgi:hypothetical protein
MDPMKRIADKIFHESQGLSTREFSIEPYRQELRSLDPVDFVVWHARYPEVYFTKLMYVTEFLWQDLAWARWQQALALASKEFHSLSNLLMFLTRFLEVDAFQTLRNHPAVAPEMIRRLKTFFAQPLHRPARKELLYLSALNETRVDLSGISQRLHQEGAPKATLLPPAITTL